MELHVTEKNIRNFEIKSGEQCPVLIDFMKSRVCFSLNKKNFSE